MLFDRTWLTGFGWEHSLAIAGCGVLVLSLAAVLVARCLRGSPAMRDTLLFSALIGCLAAPLIGLVVALTGAPFVAVPVSAPANSDPRSLVEQSARNAPASASAAPTTALSHEALLPPLLPPETADATTPARVAATKPLSAKLSTKPAPAAPFVAAVKPGALIVLAWLAGVLLLAAFAVRSFRQVNRIRRRAIVPTTRRHDPIAEAAAIAVGLPHPPAVLESLDVATPVVIGFRSPAVVLPPRVLENVSDDELRDIFIHELAHVRRRDQWVVCAQALARCLFWPIVTIHWLNRELSRSREEVCDNFVLARQDAIAYGELLLRLAQLAMGAHRLAATTGILNYEGELEGRVARMLDPQASRATASPRAANLLFLFAFLLAATALCGTRFLAAQPARGTSGTKEPARSGRDAAGTPQQEPKPAADALGDPLPEGALLRFGTLRFRPPSISEEIALSPDEKTIVTIGDQLIAWDTQTGKERWRAGSRDFGYDPKAASYGTRALVFSSESSRFYTPGRENEVVIWGTASGEQEVLAIERPKGGFQIGDRLSDARPRSVDVTPDGRKLAVGTAAGVVVCDNQGEVLFEVPNEPAAALKIDNEDRLGMWGQHYSYARFSPNGLVLAVLTSDRPDELRLYDVESGDELRKLALESKLVRLAFSPDGRQIAATERDSAVRLYDAKTGQRIWEHVVELTNPYENYTSAIAFSPDGKTIAACATDHKIYLFNSSTGEEAGKLVGHHWYPWALAFTASGKMLYSSGWDGTLRRWDMATGRQLAPPAGTHATEIVAASPQGHTLAWVDDSRTVHLAEVRNGTDLRRLALPDMEYSQLRFSPDGGQLAAGGSSGPDVQVVLWDVASGEIVRHWKWPKGRDPHSAVEALSFSPDGNRLAAAVFRQGAIRVWELEGGLQVAQLAHREVYGLSFSPDGKTFATAGWDSAVRFWDAGNWAVAREVKLPDVGGRDGDTRMYAVCYAPEGGLLATAHLDGVVRVWNANDMLLRTQFNVKWRFSYGATSFSPDGLWLATGAAGGQVELWDPLTGAKVWDRGKHQHYVYTVDFGRDSRTLVSGADDGICYLWDLRPAEITAPDELNRLWDDLSGEDGAAAYQAMWALCEIPDRAVGLLTEKLRAVKFVVDPEHLDEEAAPEDEARRNRLRKLLAAEDPQVALALPVRRAAAVLAQIGTKKGKFSQSQRLLEELAARDPDGDLGKIATGALKRLPVVGP